MAKLDCYLFQIWRLPVFHNNIEQIENVLCCSSTEHFLISVSVKHCISLSEGKGTDRQNLPQLESQGEALTKVTEANSMHEERGLKFALRRYKGNY